MKIETDHTNPHQSFCGCATVHSYAQKPMPTPKQTYEYCEHLVQEKIDEIFVAVGKWSREYDDHSEEFISFKQRRSEELKGLYNHLENIQKMKTSYFSGR